MAPATSVPVLASVRTYPLTSMITDAFCASVRPVPRMLARADSNQATSFGRAGRPLIGTRSAQACAYKTRRMPHAHRVKPSRQSSPGPAGAGGGPSTASTISATSSSLAARYRYSDIGAAPSWAATRLIDTAASPSASATCTPASTIRARLRPGLGPRCGRSRRSGKR